MRKSGTGHINQDGYHRITRGGVQKMAHVLVVERALGKALPHGVIVHHINRDKLDNRPENLLVCREAYHRLLHQRMDAIDACGHADWRKCWYCKKYDAPGHLIIRHGHAQHRECLREDNRKRKGVKTPINSLAGMGSKRRCNYCKQYDDLVNMRVGKCNTYHTACRREYDRERNSRA